MSLAVFFFCFIADISFRTRHRLFCRHGVRLAGTRQLRPHGAGSVHAHYTEGVAKGREGANGNGDGNEDGDGDGDGNESSSRDGNGDWTREEIGEWKGNENGEGKWEGRELWYSPHQERSRVQEQALPFRAQHHLCRREAAPTGSQQLMAQDPASVRRCGNEGRAGRRGREGGNGGGDEDKYGNEHEGRNGGE